MQFSFLTITASAVAAETGKKKGSKSVSHKVKKGETVYSVAKKYGVSTAELAKANKIKDNLIKEGQTLVIPVKTEPKKIKPSAPAAKTSAPAKTGKTDKTAKAAPAKTVSKPNVFEPKIVEEEPSVVNKDVSDKDLTKPSVTYKGAGVHFVKAGDSFSKIEKMYGLRKGELKYYSTNSEIKNLEPGSKVQLPERVFVRNIHNKHDVAKALGVSKNYIDFLEDIEKPLSRTANDGANNPTIGIGHHVFGAFEKQYYKNRNINGTKEKYQLLAQDLAKAKNTIIKSIGQEAYDKMSTNQKEAIIDYVFNRGMDAFRSSDCKPLRTALKNGDYEAAAINMYTTGTFNNPKIRLGISKRRLYEIHRFCGGKMTPKVLKRAQVLYEAGLKSPSAKNDSTLAGFNKEIDALYKGRIKIKDKV